MITLRRAKERSHDQQRLQEVWHTFAPKDPNDTLANGFGGLELLDEERLPPAAGIPRRPRRDAEIVTYVHEGTLAYESSAGRSGVIVAGEFQRMTVGQNVHHSEANASRSSWAHVYQIWLHSNETAPASSHEQKRFAAAERRGLLCLVAAPDAQKGSLRLRQDTFVYSALLDPGQHVVHELPQGRQAWLHLIEGAVMFGDVLLTAGDGVGITAEHAVSLTARDVSELLLVDLGLDPRANNNAH